MKIMIVYFVAFCGILGIVSTVDAATRREVVIDTLLFRTSPVKALSSSADASASVVDLSEPFSLAKGLQGSANQEDIFTRWKGHYGFSFKTTADEAAVKTTFTKRLNDVVEHNKRFDSGLEIFWKTVDGYSGLEESDFVLLRTGLKAPKAPKKKSKKLRGSLREKRSLRLSRRKPTKSATTTTTTTTTTKPTTTTTTTASTPAVTTVDYTTSPYYMPVKDQGYCGSCWAFASVAAMEFQINMLNNVSTTDLSEQQVVDCDKTNWGCDGGWPHFTFKSLIGSGFGVIVDSSYPYTAIKGTCKTTFKKENYKVLSQTGYYAEGGGWGLGTEAQLEALVRQKPVVVALCADTLGSYAGGILNNCPTGSTPNHAVVVVGYGVANGVPYWIIRNSWGASWGEKGHFRMEKGKLMCNIQKYFTEPELSTSV